MMRKFQVWGSALLALLVLAPSHAARVTPLGSEHMIKAERRPDGSFDVTCVDGEVEVRTAQEFANGEVCTHIQTFSGSWTLVEGGVVDGMRLCDLEMTHITGKNRILMVDVGFSAPCNTARVQTEECNGLVCSVRLGNHNYEIDFSTRDQLGLTRLSDGFKAIYTGNSGAIGISKSRVRTSRLGGVENILEATNDDGMTWLPVCDDGFNEAAARVVCREMGFEEVLSYKLAVTVSGHPDYGLDDINCKGGEASLLDCGHSEWGKENCGEGEHIQIACL